MMLFYNYYSLLAFSLPVKSYHKFLITQGYNMIILGCVYKTTGLGIQEEK